MCSGSLDCTIKLWCLRTGVVLRTMSDHTRPVRSVSFSGSGMEILSGGSKGGTTDKNIILYTLNALSKNSEKKKDKEELEEGIRVLEVSKIAAPPQTDTVNDASTWWMVTGGTKSSLSIWNYKVLAEDQRGISGEGVWERNPFTKALKIDQGMVNALSISSDGKTFVSGDRDNHVIVWQVVTMTLNDGHSYSYKKLKRIDAGDEVR